MSRPNPGIRFASVEASLRALDETHGDVLVLAIFSDERPLKGLAGHVDWRLAGALSRWMQGGLASGVDAERVLYPTAGRLSHRQVLLWGLGEIRRHRTDRAFAAARAAAEAVRDLGATTMTSGLWGLGRLPTPLGRSLPDLLSAMEAVGGLEAITLAAPPEHRVALAEALAARGRR